MGNVDIAMPCNQLEKYVKKDEEDTGFRIKKKPVITFNNFFNGDLTFNNFFSGDVIMDWYRKSQWGLVMTYRRDRFSSDLDNKFLPLTGEAMNNVNKVAEFNNPICNSEKSGSR